MGETMCFPAKLAASGALARMLGWAAAFGAVTSALAQSLPSDYRIRARTVPAGVERQIWTSWSIDANCEVIRGFNVQVSKPPSLGNVRLSKVEKVIDQSFLNAENIQPGQRKNAQNCLGKTVLTIGVFYQSKAGASGRDALSLVITNARQTRQRVVDLNIRLR